MNSPGSNRRFAQLEDDRVHEGFAVLQRAGEWLTSLGRRQRITNTTFDNYSLWQSDGDNYAVLESDRVVAVATLRLEVLKDWPDYSECGPSLMLRGLATDPDFRGSGAGTFAIDQIKSLRMDEGDIYLDCVSDFLPDYYQRHGFETIDQRILNCPDEPPYDITLMQFARP
ncbi:MAG: GNAT family N-acetyltransferase [Planctomycetota bacterium]